MPWLDLAHHCAPTVHHVTLERVIAVESGGDPFALHVNKFRGPQPHPKSAVEAIATAQRFIQMGYSVDLGWMQVNSKNLPALGYQLDQIFDACTNLRAGSEILTAAYNRALKITQAGQPALKVALSIYNTGDPERGFLNGYVRKYYVSVPAIPELHVPAAKVASVAVRKPINPYTADSEVWSAGYASVD